jgi:hypothetical protein
VSKKDPESGTKKSQSKMDRIFGRGESNLVLQATGLSRFYKKESSMCTAHHAVILDEGMTDKTGEVFHKKMLRWRETQKGNQDN